MPTYDYSCPNCSKPFSSVKGIKDYDRDPSSHCDHCGHVCGASDRDFSHCKFVFSGTAVTSAEYNPGLGKVVKSKYHKSEIMKQKGLIEIGNDFGSGEKMQTHYDTRKKEEREKRWRNELGEMDVG